MVRIISTLSADKKRRIPAVDHSLLEPIGELTVYFAMLEEEVKHGVYLLLGGDHFVRLIVTTELSYRRAVELLNALYLHRFPDKDQDTLKKLSKKLYTLEAKRNVIVHSYWGKHSMKSEGTTRSKTTAKAEGLKFQDETISRHDIEKIVEEIGELAVELESFYDTFD